MALRLLTCLVLLESRVAPATITVQEGSVRLAGGNTDAGRVEVFYRGKWGWLCLHGSEGERGLDGWGKAVSEVVCKQLGLRRGVSTMRMANGHFDDVLPIVAAECNGTESSIIDCQLLTGEAPENMCAEHAELPAGAGVRCSNFGVEDQPWIQLLGKAPEGLLSDASLRIFCKSDPEANRRDAGTKLPTFACTVQHYATAAANETAVCPDDKEESSSSCQTLGTEVANIEVPNPFVPEAALEAYVFKAAMHDHLRTAQEQRNASLSLPRQKEHLLAFERAGAKWLPIGLELAPQARQQAENEESLAALRSTFFSPVARLLFDLDADVIGLRGWKAGQESMSAALAPEALRIYSSLEARGAVELGDLGLSEELQQEALAALGDKASGGKPAAVNTPLPRLEKWLQDNTTLRAAIAAYFGGHALLHGYKVVHLPSQVTPKEFIASHWHHDRAGRRLKMFILLNDVDSVEGHPTQVALGSHRLSYYWHEDFEQSRYDDSYVQKSFETVRFSGARGTGYMFDTNTIHKGTPEGSLGRNVIVVEYHQAAKCGLIARLGLNIPCPSGDQKALNWYFSLA